MTQVPPARVRRYAGLAVALVGLRCNQHAAAQPVLHEYFDVTSEQQGAEQEAASEAPGQRDLRSLPGQRAPGEVEVERGFGVYAPIAEEGGYQLDGNTSRPNSVAYDDPFVPSIPVFKRLFAYNSVGPDFEMVVYPEAPVSELQVLPIGGQAEPLEDQFQAALDVTVPLKRLAVRIPNLGPRTRVLGARITPAAPFRIRRDAAENWFLEVDEPGAYQLSMHLSMHTGAFAAGFDNTTWSDIVEQVPPLPPAVRDAATGVLSELGVSRTRMSPRQAVNRLVNYFRDFEAYDGQQTGRGAPLYTSIALGGRGVCRHRSFAFVVSALALGIPSRLIRNEAHAWVEVSDGRFWRRVDLGGAAGSLDLAGAFAQRYNMPEDPYVWPLRSESAESAVERELQAAQAAGSSLDMGSSPDTVEPSGLPARALASASPSARAPAAADTQQGNVSRIVASTPEPVKLSVEYSAKSAVRGSRIELRGTAQKLSGESCSLVRVDISLQGAGGGLFGLGSLVTNARGEFRGQLTVPNNVPVGDYRVYAVSPGDLQCGPGTATSD